MSEWSIQNRHVSINFEQTSNPADFLAEHGVASLEIFWYIMHLDDFVLSTKHEPTLDRVAISQVAIWTFWNIYHLADIFNSAGVFILLGSDRSPRNHWRTMMMISQQVQGCHTTCRIKYELAVCSEGMTEAKPRLFRQNRPASEYNIWHTPLLTGAVVVHTRAPENEKNVVW